MTINANLPDVQLGDVVRDKITGLQGVAIGITHWLSQCTQVIVKPQELHEGKTVDASWFDITHLEIVEAGKYADMGRAFDAYSKAGGPYGGNNGSPQP